MTATVAAKILKEILGEDDCGEVVGRLADQ